PANGLRSIPEEARNLFGRPVGHWPGWFDRLGLFMHRQLSQLCFVAAIGLAQTRTPPGDWPMFNRDLAGTRYSPLTQINPRNVAELQQVWTYRLQPAGFRYATASGTSELTPIVVNGVMYVSAQKYVAALEPETGNELWHYDVASGQASPRGVAYWPGDRQNPPRILFTAGPKLVALNARTGK